jgi:peptidoglycan/xylan/chitin deacetylase (PgdA/CDA1 family)
MFKKSDYYFLKPLIPRRLQIAIRRELIRRQLPLVKNVWPISETASKPPDGWQGWPGDKKFALVLTHDVEMANDLEKCQVLAEIEEHRGLRSSFNFVARDYRVSQKLSRYLIDHGFEIGLHGLNHDKNPFLPVSAFLKRASKINYYLKEWRAVGFRSPSMYHDLQLLHHLNIEYDASTFDTDPFEPQPDGMGTIFPFWVPGNARHMGYVELPYTLPQDFLLFILMQKDNIDIWKEKLDWIVANGGMALFITHPNYMNFDNRTHFEEYPARYYVEFLKYIESEYKGQYWNVLPKELAFWWKANFGSNLLSQ